MKRIALAISVMFCRLLVVCDDDFNRSVLPNILLRRFAVNGVSQLQLVLFELKYYKHTGTMIRLASHLRMCHSRLTLSPSLWRQTLYWLLLSPIEISHLTHHSQRWQPTLLARTTVEQLRIWHESKRFFQVYIRRWKHYIPLSWWHPRQKPRLTAEVGWRDTYQKLAGSRWKDWRIPKRSKHKD